MRFGEALSKSTLVRHGTVANGNWLRYLPESNTFHSFGSGEEIPNDFPEDMDGWEISDGSIGLPPE